MITSSADAFFSALATQVKLEQTALYRKCRGLPAKAVPELRPSYYPGRPVEPRVLPLLSVGEMTLRLYGALNYSQNSPHDLRCALNGA